MENMPAGGSAAGNAGRGVFRGVAFDLDGTLYPNYRLYLRLLPSLFRHPLFLSALNSARSDLHRQASSAAAAADFYERQSLLMGKSLKKDPRWVRERTEIIIYRNWEDRFSGIKLFPHVAETLTAFRRAGLRLGLLSDFPPERKLAFLGLGALFDAAFSSEETGFLKPHKTPFAKLAEALVLAPGEILYVGNSPLYDAAGARAAGMHSALIRRGFFSTGSYSGAGGADFIFRDYRQLQQYVLG
jgi:putative hydrolase of the HAD superfamily